MPCRGCLVYATDFLRAPSLRAPSVESLMVCCCFLVSLGCGTVNLAVLVFGFYAGLGTMLHKLHGVVGRVCDWAVLRGSCTIECNQPTNLHRSCCGVPSIEENKACDLLHINCMSVDMPAECLLQHIPLVEPWNVLRTCDSFSHVHPCDDAWTKGFPSERPVL
eukprot:jgi/Chrzof1/5831/Cz16g17140.t1